MTAKSKPATVGNCARCGERPAEVCIPCQRAAVAAAERDWRNARGLMVDMLSDLERRNAALEQALDVARRTIVEYEAREDRAHAAIRTWGEQQTERRRARQTGAVL